MARRRFGRRFSGGRRRKRVVWDALNLSGSDTPVLPVFTGGANLGVLGRATGIRRYTSTADALLEGMRASVRGSGSWTDGATPMTRSGGIEICLGWTWEDDISSTNGQALNRAVSAGTGPLDDADNSRWFARCCINIPLGQLMFSTTGDHACVVYPVAGDHLVEFCWLKSSATQILFSWYCTLRSKSKRRLDGLETQWMTLHMQGRTYDVAGTLGTWDLSTDFYESRWVLSFPR